jgi:CheY-like chemotaxis protein
MASQSLEVLEAWSLVAAEGRPVRDSKMKRKGDHFDKPGRSKATSRVGRSRGRSIAIVEDERELLSTYSALFKKLGWSVVFESENGEEIVDAVKKKQIKPDVVIMDYRLPGNDGIDTARRIRMSLPGLKVVITTADESARGLAEAAGLLFLQKPFRLSELLRFLGNF